jgi:uncharacterized protein (DUF2132 family)
MNVDRCLGKGESDLWLVIVCGLCLPLIYGSEDMTDHPAHDPLHGITLEMMLNQLREHYGWEKLGRIIPVRCFTHDPSIQSSLKFLRKTPWARKKVEALYLRYKKGLMTSGIGHPQ